MKLIWKIFVRDVRQATRNVIAVIVAMGLVIVPALYAWYNIAASWDPYKNTGNLKVAVASIDEGYDGRLNPCGNQRGRPGTLHDAKQHSDGMDLHHQGQGHPWR